MKRFIAVLKARNLEFLRDRSALAWIVMMPFFLVLGFAFIFSEDNRAIYKIGFLGDEKQLQAQYATLHNTKHVQFISFESPSKAIDKITHHQIDLLIDVTTSPTYWVNSSSPSGYITERILWASGGESWQRSTVDGEEIRYVDWVLPGILAFNIMMGALFGVGYVIVRYRKSGYLKRLHATPLTAFEFLLAQMGSRMLLMQAITVFVYVGCNFFLDFTMLGSYLLLFCVALLGTVCMISLGLLVAARIASEELAGGLLNFLTWPMMILSGVWFSLEGAHPWVQQFALLLPLTHLVDAARAIMTEGAGLLEVAPNIIYLTVLSVIFLSIGAKVFRWH